MQFRTTKAIAKMATVLVLILALEQSSMPISSSASSPANATQDSLQSSQVELLSVARASTPTGSGSDEVPGDHFYVYLPIVVRSTPGGNKLGPEVAAKVDQQVGKYSDRCKGTSVGLVYGGHVVYIKTYGSNTTAQLHEWASVSKPLTALALMRLYERGLMTLNTPIWEYAPKYYDLIPSQFKSTPLTLQHLLTHMGGVKHLGDENTSAMFVAEPGTQFMYSTNGFGIIGDVMESVLHTSYSTIVRTEIANQIGAPTLTASDQFIASGALVKSNIQDFASFAAGIIHNSFVTSDTLYNKMLKSYVPGYSMGLGFQVSGSGDNIAALHSGSNGTPKAFLYVKPRLKRAVTIFCDARYDWSDSSVLANLSESLDSILASNGNPCVNPSDCQSVAALLDETHASQLDKPDTLPDTLAVEPTEP